MHDPPLLVLLDGHADRSLLGGKAAALDLLIELGHPVPRAAVLTHAAGRLVDDSPPVADLLLRLAHAPAAALDEAPDAEPDDEPDEASDDEIDRTFLDAPLPDALTATIGELGRALHGPLAVRSSATAEDLGASAFAGQYRTVLDVCPEDPGRLERAVRLVWASLWHDAPRRYRSLLGLDTDEPAMAVLVMEMIDAETSGVLFTRNPIGDRADLRLETVAGSGDALVSGAVTPSAHVWPRSEAVARAGRELGPPFGELVERALAVEAAARTPQDVEFAVDHEGRLWLLQARPITTLADDSDLTRSGIAEMLPGTLPPLLQATAGRFVDEGLRNLLTDLGGTTDGPLIRFERSRAMLDLANLRRATATVPGGSVAELDRGDSAAPHPADPGEQRGSSVARTARILRRRRAAALEAEIVDAATDRLVATDAPTDPLADPLVDVRSDALLARWERVLDLGMRATSSEMAVAALATAAYQGAERTLARHLPDAEATALAQRLTRRPRSGGPLARCTRDRQDGDDWSACLASSGSRSVFGGPTWADEPELARLAIESPPRHENDGPDHTDTDLVRRGLDDVPNLTPLRRRFLRREIADAASLLDRRERTKQSLLDIGGIAHRVTLEIGHELAGRGILQRPDDVWLLTPPEVRTALRHGTLPAGLDGRRRAFDADALAATTSTSRPGEGHGWGASPGTATGRARIVETPRAGALAPGEVLVARHTDAGWSPLFAIAGAIVVEEGGPLSHAAIVARELGVPAVVNVPGIVDRVRRAGPDAALMVDGTTGAVDVRAEPRAGQPAAAAVPVLAPPDETPRVAVFVTGLIGASALLGTAVSITQAVSSGRGAQRLRDRAAAPAAVLARVVSGGTDVARRASDGLPSARRYGWLALVAVVLAISVAGTGVGEYVTSEPGGSVFGLAALLSATGVLATVAAGGALAWWRWPDVPPTVRRLTPARSRSRRILSIRQFWAALPELHRRWLVFTGSIALALLVWNTTDEPSLRRVDEWLTERIGAPHADPIGPEWFGMYFGRPQIVIPAALIVALFTVRCRVLAIAYPATIAFGGIVNLGLGMLVGRARPPHGAHWYQHDSFPSGHAIEVTLLLGLLPLGVAVLLRSRRAGRATRVVATAVLVVMLVDGLREGSHWPSDHLAGFAIALFAVIFVHALARTPDLHRSCTRCPALAIDPSSDRPASDVHGDAP